MENIHRRNTEVSHVQEPSHRAGFFVSKICCESHSQGGPSGGPGRGMAGSHALRKNTGSMCSPYLCYWGWLKRAAWEDTQFMRVSNQRLVNGVATNFTWKSDRPRRLTSYGPTTRTYSKARHIGGPFFFVRHSR